MQDSSHSASTKFVPFILKSDKALTTIAFRDRIMAADSRFSDSEKQLLTTGEKIIQLPSGALYGAAGDGDDREIVALLQKATPSRLPSRRALLDTEREINAILAFPSGPVFYVAIFHDPEKCAWDACITRCLLPFCAVGTGNDYAVGAMEHGATAAEAVAIACLHDAGSGPPVFTIELPQPRRTRKAVQ